jgi:predicted transcriptional regulator
MTVDQTSILAYDHIKPHLGIKQNIVYDTIKNHPYVSNEDISNILGWRINTVTPRVKELREYGSVMRGGYGISKRTGKKVNLWIVKE